MRSTTQVLVKPNGQNYKELLCEVLMQMFLSFGICSVWLQCLIFGTELAQGVSPCVVQYSALFRFCRRDVTALFAYVEHPHDAFVSFFFGKMKEVKPMGYASFGTQEHPASM